jgi:hypothetical protein
MSYWCMIGGGFRIFLFFFFFFNALYSFREVKISADGFLKKDDILRSKLFTKFYFSTLTLLFNVDSCFPWKRIWRTKAPMMVAFFTSTTFS